MVMTIHKLTAGDGYRYLTRHIAGGDVDRQRGQDAADYYTAEGNPPGRWLGAGAAHLGVDPAVVTEEQMRNLFGLGLHPDADSLIADYQAAHITATTTDPQREAVMVAARRHAALGRQFPVYKALDPYETRVACRLAVITEDMHRPPAAAEVAKVRREEATRQRAAVAGYDLVFAPVKSAALLWALDDRDWVRRAVREAHEEARDAALSMLEQHAAYTRTGKAGVAQIETRGLVAVAFDHYDSRRGDPNLHTHLVVSNKIQGVDGKWRSLDARALYQLTVAVSEFYNTAFETALCARLPVTFTARADTPTGKEAVREVDGVPAEWIAHFSRRRTELEARYDELLREYRTTHGHDPPRKVAHKIARQATLDTREGKKPPRSLLAMRADWRTQITDTFGPQALHKLRDLLPASAADLAAALRPDRIGVLPADGPPADGAAHERSPHAPSARPVDELAATVIARVAEQRATWTRWNVHAEAERLLREETSRTGPFAALADHHDLVTRVVDLAISPAHSIAVDAPAFTNEPAALRRTDGVSVFTPHAAARYTSATILDAEQRLLHAATGPAAASLPSGSTTAALHRYERRFGHQLNSGQRNLVAAFATATTTVAVGIGAAGTGKTTAMKALRHVVEAHGRRLVPLSTSAVAAAVLAADIGAPAENLHKFLWEHTAGRGAHAHALHTGGLVPPSHRFFAIRSGDVILVDEAGMAGTLLLDRLVAIATHHDATVRLLGDWRQLGAVESGGALRLLATEAGAVELTTLHRFVNPAEAAATLKLRTGDTAALDFYQAEGRITGGSRQAMIDAAYTAWRTDMASGRTTLMIAATNRDITTLATRARTDRVAAGQVEAAGVALHDGTLAGTGDWVITRANDRTTTTHHGKDWVKNGDAWTVLRQHPNGSLLVQHQGHGGRLVLGPDYVARHVQLHYATTTHRAQGATVDTAHLLVDDHLTRENLYVALTRARLTSHAYVATHEFLPLDEDDRIDRPRHDPDARAAREVLDAILRTDGAPLSATDTIRESQQRAASLATLAPRYLHAADQAATATYTQIVHDLFAPHTADQLVTDPAFTAVVRALRRGESLGWQPEQLLVRAAARGPLTAADSPAQMLAWRCTTTVDEHAAPAQLRRPTSDDIRRYATLVTAARIPTELLDTDTARTRPAALTVRTTDTTTRQPDRYQQIIADVLGPRLTIRVAAEPAWPALTAALRRAEHAGHNPADILTRAVTQRELATAVSASEVLAWRIGRYLHRRPETPEPAPQPHPVAHTWNVLAWTLKAYEEHGRDAEQLISSVSVGIDDAPDDQRLDLLLDGVQSASRRVRPSPDPSAALPPWLAVTGTSNTDYLAAVRKEISTRIQTSAHDAARRPAWTTVFGVEPDDPAVREQWLRQLGIVAAYRDQYEVTGDHSRQPLGPYIDPGRAGHTAYWHAATAVITAHRLTQPADAQRLHDPVLARIADDIRSALPDAERAHINTTMANRLGPLWFGPSDDADTAALQPAHAAHLIAVMSDLGYLTNRPGNANTDCTNSNTAVEDRRRAAAAREAEHLALAAERSRQRTLNARRREPIHEVLSTPPPALQHPESPTLRP